ncbi:MAG: branched-chain amino acid ABC transporter substrate-binding protein [candidate division NC10 bacterium]|nr:branched-chain amino acid ABC transporter substrate-binding protein [candidate division NC10 bacterium]
MRWLWLPLFLGWTLSAHAAEVAAVRLGLVVPMVSEAGPVAQSMRRAAEMAVDDWTPKLRRAVELRVKEDQFDPKQAVLTAEKLVQEAVWGVVGHFYSSSSVPASAVYRQAGIPLVTATSTHPRLTSQGFDNVFRVSGRDDQQAIAAAEFVLAQLKPRRVAVIHDQTEYGRALAETFTRALGRRGPRRVLLTEIVSQGDKDFSAQVARLKAAAPDVVYFGGIFREAGHLVRQMRQGGMTAVFVSCDAVLDPEFIKLAGEDAVTGIYLTFAPDPRLLQSAASLIRRYELQYGSLGPYVLYVYDAVGVLLQAIQVAKPVDNSTQELQKVLRAIRTRAYVGALGTLRWDRNGDLATPPYVIYAAKRGGSVHGWFEQLVSRPAASGKTPERR